MDADVHYSKSILHCPTWQEFDENDHLKPSAYRDRVVDVLEELFKITLLMRDQSSYLTKRFSETGSELYASDMRNKASDIETPNTLIQQ